MDTLTKRIGDRLGKMSGPFPTSEIWRIASPSDHGSLAGNLDLYFHFVHSCSTALHLLNTKRKSRDELLQIRDRLSLSFFARHPELSRYVESIGPESTPSLFAQLTATESNRVDLLEFLDAVLQAERKKEEKRK